MCKKTKIVLSVSTISFILCAKAYAFFPIPVPLIGADIANNSADMVENVNAVAEKVEEGKQVVQKTIEEAKSGKFGFDAIKNYTNTLSSINLNRMVPELQLPCGVGKNVNNPDKLSQSVKNNYIGTISEDGDQMQDAAINDLKRTELMQENISSLYAHALATRVNLAKEREMPETELKSENTREIIQSNRALSDKMLKRWNDMLFMVAQMDQFKTAKELTSITLEPEKTEDFGVKPGEDVKSDEEEAQNNSAPTPENKNDEAKEQGEKK